MPVLHSKICVLVMLSFQILWTNKAIILFSTLGYSAQIHSQILSCGIKPSPNEIKKGPPGAFSHNVLVCTTYWHIIADLSGKWSLLVLWCQHSCWSWAPLSSSGGLLPSLTLQLLDWPGCDDITHVHAWLNVHKCWQAGGSRYDRRVQKGFFCSKNPTSQELFLI